MRADLFRHVAGWQAAGNRRGERSPMVHRRAVSPRVEKQTLRPASVVRGFHQGSGGRGAVGVTDIDANSGGEPISLERDDKGTKQATIFIDTNVISLLANGRQPLLLDGLLQDSFVLVTSDSVVKEVSAGTPSGEIALLEKLNFRFLKSDEAIFINGLTNFYDFSALNIDDGAEIRTEQYLHDLLRNLCGSSSAPALDQLLHGGIEAALSDLEEVFGGDYDVRFSKYLEAVKERIVNDKRKLGLYDSTIPDHYSTSELEALGLGPKHVNNIKPPNIARQIAERVDTKDLASYGYLLAPFTESENIRARITELGFNLLLVGFHRDTRLGKDNEQKSRIGARSQFYDIDALSCATVCHGFLTSDRRCARLAFAIYEALGIKTSVLFLDPDQEDKPLRWVGSEYWP